MYVGLFVQIHGLDTTAEEVRERVAAGQPWIMHVELVALYMPAGSIARFSKVCMSNEESGDAN